MANYKTTIILVFGLLVILITSAQISPPKKFKNLQVLPQDITEKKLDSLMHTYNKALKVKCNFCHTATNEINGNKIVAKQIDFSVDNSMKENARKMIRLTMEINKKYFYFDSTTKPEFLNVVSCNTCHRGNPYPANE